MGLAIWGLSLLAQDICGVMTIDNSHDRWLARFTTRNLDLPDPPAEQERSTDRASHPFCSQRYLISAV
jgi:hypothetical protein